jgi:glycopeptide antibiotics resistance protein
MKIPHKTLFSLYLTMLIWLVLFKFSYDIVSVLEHHQVRSLNLIPFAGYSHATAREMFENFAVFIPFGLLLAINAQRIDFWRKLGIISAFSLGVELVQFTFAIGITDITDFITNTAGGFVGLALYRLGSKYVPPKILNRVIAVTIAIVLIALFFLRVFIVRVRY